MIPPAWWARLTPWVAGWAGFSTVALAYGVFLISAAVGLRRSLTTRSAPWRQCSPGAPAFAALGLGLVISMAWTPASAAAVASHLWSVALLSMIPLLSRAWSRPAAQQALSLFVAAAALVALAHAASTLVDVPRSSLWQRALDAEGNQRIAGSLLMALASVLALDQALRPATGEAPPRTAVWVRWAWALAAAACALGVAVQDRRSGMLLWPVLLLVFGLSRLHRPGQRIALLLAVLIVCALGWTLADGVRARFAEGAAELRAPLDPSTVASSWGQRRAMVEGTLLMIGQAPWAGHGVGSWTHWWQRAMPAGSALAANSTPHSEYLLAAAQLGIGGALLLTAGFAAELRAAWRAGAAGRPALLVWTLLAVASLFNAMIRDAKFAVPLLLLAALAASVRLGAAGAERGDRPGPRLGPRPDAHPGPPR